MPPNAPTLELLTPGKPTRPRYGRKLTLAGGHKVFLPTDQRLSLVPEPNSVLTAEQVGAWLQMTTKAVLASDIPRVKLGHRTVRFHYAAVLAYLEKGSN